MRLLFRDGCARLLLSFIVVLVSAVEESAPGTSSMPCELDILHPRNLSRPLLSGAGLVLRYVHVLCMFDGFCKSALGGLRQEGVCGSWNRKSRANIAAVGAPESRP